MWQNMVEPDRATNDNIIRRMRFACWITKATDTHSEYLIRIAFPRQLWLSERASMLRYTHIPWLLIPAAKPRLFLVCPKYEHIRRNTSIVMVAGSARPTNSHILPR
jgi:hypothetical protein